MREQRIGGRHFVAEQGRAHARGGEQVRSQVGLVGLARRRLDDRRQQREPGVRVAIAFARRRLARGLPHVAHEGVAGIPGQVRALHDEAGRVHRQLADGRPLLFRREWPEMPLDGVLRPQPSLRGQLEDGGAGEHLRHRVHLEARGGGVADAVLHVGQSVAVQQHHASLARNEHRAREAVVREAGEQGVDLRARRAGDLVASQRIVGRPGQAQQQRQGGGDAHDSSRRRRRALGRDSR